MVPSHSRDVASHDILSRQSVSRHRVRWHRQPRISRAIMMSWWFLGPFLGPPGSLLFVRRCSTGRAWAAYALLRLLALAHGRVKSPDVFERPANMAHPLSEPPRQKGTPRRRSKRDKYDANRPDQRPSPIMQGKTTAPLWRIIGILFFTRL